MKRLACVALAAQLLAGSAGAAVFFGPTPYPSFADSPFAGGSYSYFHLETFEGGSLNVPGVATSTGVVLPPGNLTDSVDADDGAIDGSGAAGRSWYSQGSDTFVFTFDGAALGGLPTVAGIVWTDVGNAPGALGFGAVTFSASGPGFAGATSVGTLGDGSAAGGTAEDRFIGVSDPGGIFQITITMPGITDWEVDHLQFGRTAARLPEPGILGLVGLALAAGGIGRRARTAAR